MSGHGWASRLGRRTGGSLGRLWRGWEQFWFEPQETSTLALFRIALGAVATAWTVTLAPDLLVFFGPDGIQPDYPATTPDAWNVLRLSSGPSVVIALFAMTLVGSIALMIGLHSRFAAVLVSVGLLSFQRRNPIVFNSGDQLLLNLSLLCALAPTGTSLSVDRLRKVRKRFWEFPARSPWALRLVQIQLSVVYFSTVWQKVQGDQWRNGTAISTAMRIEDIHRFPTRRSSPTR